MATRLSLRRVGDSTGKLIAAPDSVAELLEKATKKLKLPTVCLLGCQTNASSSGVVVALGLDIADRRGGEPPDECAESPTNRSTL